MGKWHLAGDKRQADGPDYKRQGIPQEKRGGFRTYWMASDLLEFTSHGYEGYLFDGDNRRVDYEGYRVDCTTNFALDYLRDYATRQPGSPFVMYLSYIEPHHQNDLDRYVGPIGSKQRFANYRTPGDLLGTQPEPGRRADWPLHMPDYLGCCWSLDQNIGRLRQELINLGLDENTIVIYTSDHGCHFCTRNPEYKRSCHDASLRVPMIACGPGFSGGHVVEDLVSLIDLPATVVSAGTGRVPGHFMGRDLRPLVAGTASDWGDDIYAQISEAELGRTVRTARWKYGISAPDQSKWIDGHYAASEYVEAYLYDLDTDPHERLNLAADPSLHSVREEMATRLKKHAKRADEPEFKIVPAEAVA